MKIEAVEGYWEQVVAWRRDFHMHPELGFQEERTSAIVQKLLESFGLKVVTGFAKTAVLGILETGRPGKTIAVRADMDALPIQDGKDVPYRSQNDGVCHACGHDSHTANLLGVAKYAAEHKEEFCGTIKFLFQPAEEGPAPGGANLVCKSGILDGIDYIFAAHNTPEIDCGKLMVRHGYANASSDSFYLKIEGVGCHAARPNTGKDPIITGMQIIGAYQNIVSRETDPMKQIVISVCSVHAGKENATNVVPQELCLSGTLRTFDEEVRKYALQRMEEIADTICRLNGSKAEFHSVMNMPSLKNDKELTDLIKEACTEVVGAENVLERENPTMGAEDFAYYTKIYKACNFYFGSRNEKRGIIVRGHNPKFDIEEQCLLYSMAAFLTIIQKLTKQ